MFDLNDEYMKYTFGFKLINEKQVSLLNDPRINF